MRPAVAAPDVPFVTPAATSPPERVL